MRVNTPRVGWRRACGLTKGMRDDIVLREITGSLLFDIC